MKLHHAPLIATLAAIAAIGCSEAKTDKQPSQTADTAAAVETAPQQIPEPDYPRAMGFSKAVKTIEGESTDRNYEMEYHSYTFDEQGHLTEYETGETVENSLSETFFFGDDGLPTSGKSVFINYWVGDVEGDDYPVTTTPYKITKETADSVTTIHIEGGDEGKRVLATLTRDKHNRIVQVTNTELKKTFKYTYDDQNVPHYSDGSVAVPQVDMIGAPAIKCPATIKAGAKQMKAGTWTYKITYYPK